ncbi:hypothetical protein FKP32DRAFT_1067134 [Trametes sanguinea]|nr:hypothetical protein FKP32DRAFT_1067134 [Trametes sanguinea]
MPPRSGQRGSAGRNAVSLPETSTCHNDERVLGLPQLGLHHPRRPHSAQNQRESTRLRMHDPAPKLPLESLESGLLQSPRATGHWPASAPGEWRRANCTVPTHCSGSPAPCASPYGPYAGEGGQWLESGASRASRQKIPIGYSCVRSWAGGGHGSSVSGGPEGTRGVLLSTAVSISSGPRDR